MSLTLTWRAATSLPVDGSPICPASFEGTIGRRGGPHTASARQFHGRAGRAVRGRGDRGDDRLVIEGELVHVQGLGRGMAAGNLIVRGDAGPQLGAEMTGGLIEVEGTVGDWAGAEMRGGRITIRGNAGSFLGAAYPGSRLGMREGVILVEGSAGDDAGLQMRRGLIAVRGGVRDGLGRGMIAGTILALGPVGTRIGAGMKRGTLVLPGLGRDPEDLLLPTFAARGPVPVRRS